VTVKAVRFRVPSLRRVHLITDVAIARLDLDGLLDELLTRLRDTLAADTATVLTLEDDGDHLVVRAAQGVEEEASRGMRIPFGRGFAGRVLDERDAVIEDVGSAEVVDEPLRTSGLRRILGAPLLVDGRPVGLVCVGRASRRRFSDADVRLLRLAADRIGPATERARLVEAEREARASAEASSRRLRFLFEASEILSATGDYEVTLPALARLIVPELADGWMVDIVEGEKLSQVVAAHADPSKERLLGELRRYPPIPSFAGTPVAGEAIVLPEIPDELLRSLAHDATHLQLLRRIEFGPAARFPLMARGRTLGAFTFWHAAASQRRFSDGDLAVARELADRAALAIENARVFRDAELALKAQQEALAMLDAVFASAPVGFACWDAELRCVRVNASLAAMLGPPVESHLGRTPPEVLAPLNARWVEATVRGVLATGQPALNMEISGESPVDHGKTHTWAIDFHPMRSPDGEQFGVGAVINDVTERKQAELALRDSEERFRVLLDGATDYALVMLDPQGHVSAWNSGAQRAYGHAAEEVLGRHFSCFFTPEDLQLGKPGRALARAGTEGGSEDEGWRVRKDGDRFWAKTTISPVRERDGRLRGYAEVTRDVTERRHAGEALKARAAQQAAVVSLGQRAVAGVELAELTDEAVAVVAETLDVEYSEVLEVVAGGETVLLRSGVGWPQGLVGSATVGTEIDSHAGYTLHSSAPVIVDDLRTETRFRGAPLLHDHGVVSGVSVIIGKAGAPFGVLGAHTTRPRRFSPDDVNFLQAVGNIVAGVVQRRRREEEILHHGLHDGLTGLANRTLLCDRLQQAVLAARREQRGGALLLIDLYRFKEINTTLGHHVGDAVLVKVGERLQQPLRAIDSVARLGGDEFAVLLPELGRPEHAELVARKVLGVTEQPLDLEGLELAIKVSIGIACFPAHGDEETVLFQRADVAMDRAKQAGGGYALFDPEHDGVTIERLGLVRELRRAIERANSSWTTSPSSTSILVGSLR
jgi:diguanylate cyclase (GGDEF)-like protein/PAS domain S-box-containing protein